MLAASHPCAANHAARRPTPGTGETHSRQTNRGAPPLSREPRATPSHVRDRRDALAAPGPRNTTREPRCGPSHALDGRARSRNRTCREPPVCRELRMAPSHAGNGRGTLSAPGPRGEGSGATLLPRRAPCHVKDRRVPHAAPGPRGTARMPRCASRAVQRGGRAKRPRDNWPVGTPTAFLEPRSGSFHAGDGRERGIRPAESRSCHASHDAICATPGTARCARGNRRRAVRVSRATPLAVPRRGRAIRFRCTWTEISSTSHVGDG